ncbi:MAG TPA: VWA domain-containing protein, partial [Psychromonas hadalis]|nr:VWA domain-containing protein [Psychromonas hadalis]
EVIFYKHLADKRLATYQQQGKTRTVDKVVTYKRQEKQADIPKGPFIIAVDASGSMMGLPEQAAKGLAYGLMQIALAANRACYVIIFSATQITYELTHADGLSEILSFLSYTFNGGTDLTPVLENAIEQMNSEKYSNADLIVISDFISPLQAQSMLDKITDIKGNQNRFHAVSLSKHGNPELLAIFDYYWEFYPSHLGNFKKLLKKC